MALIYDQINGEAQTHVLIIGVGGYRYLSEGTEEKVQNYERVGILKQLSSPPKSALAFRDHLLEIENDEQKGFVKPLGSIELLISPSPKDPFPGEDGEQFEASNFDNVSRAYNDWKQRCDSHVDNVAIFFFSGHGVEKKDHYLLTEDFGANPNNPWLNGSFTFNKTRNAFHSCKASTQCFFIDSCRKINAGMLQSDLPDIPLDVPLLTTPDCKHDLTMKAAAHNEAAYGPQKKPSFFTQSIIKALQGYAADKRGGQWAVNTGDIAMQIHNILRMIKSTEGYKQRCVYTASEPSGIITFSKAPPAHLSVACDPAEATNVSKLKCKALEGETEFTEDPKSESWELDMIAGYYTLQTESQSEEFNNGETLALVRALTNEKINCSRNE
ncbi:caspase family protein [uncultured Aquimarina sp.]|uniref:caspase family protein n=1 Tax=uncultured Aquimarina sp. TaxID=575652 RepID=UPI00260A68A4|nr:caspase family protein [uncultured Aquimarina sp.]